MILEDHVCPMAIISPVHTDILILQWVLYLRAIDLNT